MYHPLYFNFSKATVVVIPVTAPHEIPTTTLDKFMTAPTYPTISPIQSPITIPYKTDVVFMNIFIFFIFLKLACHFFIYLKTSIWI